MAKKPKQRTVRITNREIKTIGSENAFWSDLYHRAMTATLPFFLMATLALFLLNNLLFAGLYAFDVNSVSNVAEPHFLNLFFFSVEAFTTVGFGDMHPANPWGHSVFSFEGFMSLTETAALTGLIFARFSKPRARIMFSDNPVITAYDGLPHLMIRVANSRQNFISDATAQLWLLRDEVSEDGQRFRRFHELKLLRDQNPTFVLSWVLFHTIGKNSILHGLTAEEMAEKNFQFILTIKGVDDTSSQELRARQSYTHDQLLWNHRYADIINVVNGTVTIDYRNFNITNPAP